MNNIYIFYAEPWSTIKGNPVSSLMENFNVANNHIRKSTDSYGIPVGGSNTKILYDLTITISNNRT